MKKTTTITLIIIITLLLTGCNLIKKTGPTDKTKGELITPTEAQIHKGTKGLTIEFVKGQPPASTWENIEFPIIVRIQNEGAHDIQRGLLAITGGLYFIADQKINFGLEGKSEFNPEGGFSFEKFPATTGTVESDKTDTFFVIACYEYKTYGSATICINPRIMEEDNLPRGECKTGTVTLSGGQGAPIAVTKIEQEIIPIGENTLKMNLKIHVSNQGGGKAITKERDAYMKDCTGQPLTTDELGKITVDQIMFSNYRLGSIQAGITCINLKEDKTFVLDKTGQYIIDCYAEMDPASIGSAAFTTPLLIELSYGYSQTSSSKSITIKNTAET